MAARVAAIVLAAGLGTRMRGRNKLLAPLHGKPVIAHVLDTVLDAPLIQVIVVTSDADPALGELLTAYAVDLVRNPDPAAGMGASIACATGAIAAGIDGVLICLGDMPLVQPTTITQLLAAFTKSQTICVPIHAARRGHPVLFPAHYLPQLAELTGDQGARRLIAGNDVQELPVGDAGVLFDIDTPEMLATAAYPA